MFVIAASIMSNRSEISSTSIRTCEAKEPDRVNGPIEERWKMH